MICKINFCMFCGASGQGIPFGKQDTDNEYLYDIIQFDNVHLPVITSGVLQQKGYYSGFSYGTTGKGGMMVLYDPSSNVNLGWWAGDSISKIKTATYIIPKGYPTKTFDGIIL